MARQSLDQAILRIKSLERKGDLDAAREMCLALIAQFPANRRLRKTLDGLGKARLRPAATGQAPQAELEVMVTMFHNKEYKAVVRHGEQLARRYPYSPVLFNILASAAAEDGKIDKAVEAYKRAIELDPGFVDAINNLGGILKNNGREVEAVDWLTRSLRVRPDQPVILRHIAEMERELLRHRDAIAHFRSALETMPDDADSHYGLALALIEVEDLDAALAAVERAIALVPQKLKFRMTKAQVLRLLGRNDEATEVYEAILKDKPGFAGPYWGLSSIHRFAPDDPLIGRIEAAYAAPGITAEERSKLAFALSKAREDIGDLQGSFELLKQANHLRREADHYRFDREEKEFADLRKAAPNLVKFALPAGVSPVETVPVFILAMPRSGTSLLEQILSSHSMVAAGGELPYLAKFGFNLATGAVPATTSALRGLRGDYLASIRPNAGGSRWLTDKMPHNFRLVALIRAAMPEAKIIHVHRDPAAVCWSNFKQNFNSDKLDYGCDLQDVVRYYKLYAELMALWKSMFGEAIYTLDYERLTVEQEDETRKLLDHLGLPWEEACLAPQRNKRGVRTASEQQVKKAVYKGSSAEWRKFEPFLDGAFDALQG